MKITAKVKNARPRRLLSIMRRKANDRTAIHAAGDYIREGLNPPVLTGDLAAGIRVEKGSGTYRILSTAKHSKYVEFGTQNMQPRAFMRTAFRKRKKGALTRYKSALKRKR